MINARNGEPLGASTEEQRKGLWRQVLRECKAEPPIAIDLVLHFLRKCSKRVSARHVQHLFRVICNEHEARGFNHLQSAELHQAVATIAKRAHGGDIRMSQLIDKEEVRQVVVTTGHSRLIDARDSAMILVILAGWLTREQCVTLMLEDIEGIPGLGYSAYFGGAFPKEITIPQVDHDTVLCPVRALNRFFRQLDRESGPAFPAMTQRGALTRPMGVKGLQKMLSLRFKAAGVYRTGLGSSSLRFSGVTAAILHGEHRESIERHAGWRAWDSFDKALDRTQLYNPFDSEDL